MERRETLGSFLALLAAHVRPLFVPNGRFLGPSQEPPPPLASFLMAVMVIPVPLVPIGDVPRRRRCVIKTSFYGSYDQ